MEANVLAVSVAGGGRSERGHSIRRDRREELAEIEPELDLGKLLPSITTDAVSALRPTAARDTDR